MFYNFNADFFPQNKFSGIQNILSDKDINKYRTFVDAVVIAGLSAGEEIKDLYSWVIENGLTDRVFMIGAGYENDYVAKHILVEPELTIFKRAQVITGRTRKHPALIDEMKLPYHHINCPAILSVPKVKEIAPGKTIRKIAFSIQLPTEAGIVNQVCSRQMYELSIGILNSLSADYELSIIAHHKSEYFHFLNYVQERNLRIPVIFSSFYQDLHAEYPKYDMVITTRLHSSLFANGFGIPGIILNDTDRHTHCLEGFQYSYWVNTIADFKKRFSMLQSISLHDAARDISVFKENLLAKYVSVLTPYFANVAKPPVERVYTLRLSSGAAVTTHPIIKTSY
jgi:hypothetical protein